MPKPKWNLNTIYISERLQESLRPISRCAMTTVVAPMGYGKTTAVNWFLAAQPPGSAIRVSIYSDSLPALWESGRRAFRAAGLTVLEGFDCPTDPAATGLLTARSRLIRVGRRTALFGETLEIIDYSPEIDTELRIICFPTFKGHCGCLLLDISETNFSVEKTVGEKAILMYLKKLME